MSSTRGRRRAAGSMASPNGRDRARIKLRGPADFVAIVPYLLGFHPRNSIVALLFDHGRVGLTARVDLPGAPGGPPTPGALARHLGDLARQAGAQSVVLLCYVAATGPLPDFEELARDDRLPVSEAVQVSPSRWWSVLCRDPGCCPAEGTPYDLGSHPLTAEAVLAGLTAMPERDALTAWVAGPSVAAHPRLERLAADALVELPLGKVSRKRLMHHLVTSALLRPERLTERECAELAALCVELDVRDVAWALMTRDDAESHLRLWRRVVSTTVDRLTPGPLGLLSVAAWLTGNGALMNLGIERLERIHPGYGLLALLQDLSRRALPPSAWDELGPALRSELDLLDS